VRAEDAILGSELDARYRVIEVLGAGGMGTVYRGEHIAIGRGVAIKILNPLLASSEGFARRFEREAKAAGRLQHPNCVPVTDFGQAADGTSYLVMDLVDGRSLSEILDEEGPLDPVRALRLARHTLRGLGHAHSCQIVHRDIKPDNIMVERHADGELARVLDFGIAKLREGDGEQLTQAGVTIGTPSYLSPAYSSSPYFSTVRPSKAPW
jgi:serine/threonine protein kinase